MPGIWGFSQFSGEKSEKILHGRSANFYGFYVILIETGKIPTLMKKYLEEFTA